MSRNPGSATRKHLKSRLVVRLWITANAAREKQEQLQTKKFQQSLYFI